MSDRVFMSGRDDTAHPYVSHEVSPKSALETIAFALTKPERYVVTATVADEDEDWFYEVNIKSTDGSEEKFTFSSGE